MILPVRIDDNFFGMGGGGRFGGNRGGLLRDGVLSGWIHWWINGMIDVVDDVLLVSFESFFIADFESISRVDCERLRLIESVFLGDRLGGDIE
jgi:hypothetical protein